MDEAEIAEAVLSFDRGHLLEHFAWRLEPKVTPEEIVRRAKRTGKRTAAANLQMNAAASSEIRIKIKSRKRQRVQISYHGSVVISDDLGPAPERDARQGFPI